MTINDLQDIIHATATAHGWWDVDVRPSFGEFIALCHSELSEALQAYRQSGDELDEAVVVEMADVIIWILDWAAAKGIDMGEVITMKNEINQNRPWRHGGKAL